MSTFWLKIYVIDGRLNTPISGAQVTFLGRPYRTDLNGLAQVFYSDPFGTAQVLVSTSGRGYDNAKATVDLSTASGTTVTVSVLFSSAAISITAVDSVSNTPLQGVQVYVDGNPPMLTGSDGSVQVSTGTHAIRLAKDGYQDVSQTSSGLSLTLPMVKAVVSQVRQEISFEPVTGTPAPTSGALVAITDGSRSEQIVVDESGRVISGNLYTLGVTLQVSASKDGWSTYVGGFVVDGTKKTLVMTKSEPTETPKAAEDPNLAPGASPTPVNTSGVVDPTAPSILPSVQKPDSYEWTYPSGEFGKYFTSAQARMYIGNLFVDELNTVQYQLQGNRIPVYGYASRDFDAVGRGKCLVQGQIMINFISEGYLYTLLKEADKLYRQQLLNDDSGAKDDQRFKQLNDQKKTLLSMLQGGQKPGTISPVGLTILPTPSGEDGYSQMATGDIQASLAVIDAELTQIAARRGSDLGKSIYGQLISTPTPPSGYPNAVYLDIPFTIELKMEGAGRTVSRRLEQCYLGSNEQIIDQSGNALMDTYTFIARRLR